MASARCATISPTQILRKSSSAEAANGHSRRGSLGRGPTALVARGNSVSALCVARTTSVAPFRHRGLFCLTRLRGTLYLYGTIFFACWMDGNSAYRWSIFSYFPAISHHKGQNGRVDEPTWCDRRRHQCVSPTCMASSCAPGCVVYHCTRFPSQSTWHDSVNYFSCPKQLRPFLFVRSMQVLRQRQSSRWRRYGAKALF